MALITQAEFARQQGWKQPYIHKLVKKGIIRLVKGKVDTEQALTAIKDNADPSTVLRNPPQPPGLPADDKKQPGITYADARTMREAYRAKMAELEYKEKAGLLTSAEKVKQQAFKSSRIIRDELLSIPERLADLLAAEDSPENVQKLLLTEIEAALNRLCT